MERRDQDRETSEDLSRSQPLPASDLSDVKAKNASFLALGRYELTEEDIHSRANVRHLMARSDQLDEAHLDLARLRERYAELHEQLAVLRERYAARGGQQVFVTFCGSAGFAGLGYGISLLTTNPLRTREGIVVTVFGFLIAVGSVIAQIRSPG